MTRAIATIFVIVLLVGTFLYAQSAAPPTPVCVTDEDRVHIRAQVLAAIDDAFRENVGHLFTGWLKDPHQQPARAAAGMQSSIVAYQRARVDALKWSPQSC